VILHDSETGQTSDGIPVEQVILETKRWLMKAVIGLNLCPFAASAQSGNRIRYCVSSQETSTGLLEELLNELQTLQAADPMECETTLLIHPRVLNDFYHYNDFLDECDAAISALGLEGELQIASFHPDYQFAESDAQDMQNYSNRSPYPMLHLLREASITRVVDSYPGIDDIASNNMRTLRSLGIAGWQQLWIDKS
jgi:hypothetical protein